MPLNTLRPSEAAPFRGNDDWVRALGENGLDGDAARQELRSMLVAALRRMLSSRGFPGDLCEDVAQEALVRVQESLATYRGESRFTTWALSIATRIAFDELRHKRWRDVSLDALAESASGPVIFEPREEASQEKNVVRGRVLGAVGAVIENKLTQKQRAVLLAELEGMPHAEIARQLGMKRNALYKLSHDARKRVKAHLEAEGIFEAEVLWVFE